MFRFRNVTSHVDFTQCGFYPACKAHAFFDNYWIFTCDHPIVVFIAVIGILLSAIIIICNVSTAFAKVLTKMVSTASLLGARHFGEVVENKPASSLVVTLGKALNGTPPPICKRQVAQTSQKWQLPSECGRPVQNIAIRFAFSLMEDKYGKFKKMIFMLQKNFLSFEKIYFAVAALLIFITYFFVFHEMLISFPVS